MGKCKELYMIWEFLDEVLSILDIQFSFKNKRTRMFHYEVMNLKPSKDFKLLLYLNTIVNYHLWKFRNDCVHLQIRFDSEQYIRRLIRSVGARKRLQLNSSIPWNRKIPRMQELFDSLLTLQNITFPVDNG